MIKYGLISEVDARCLEKTIDKILNEFDDAFIMITEIGLYNCETANGIVDYLNHKARKHFLYFGIDNEKDKKISPPQWINYIKGNSSEEYNRIGDNSQHLILVDGDHSYIGVISDFFAYCDKVKVGGYLAFHDTGKHIKPFKDFQHGNRSNPDAYISVRKALTKIGMFDDAGYDAEAIRKGIRYKGNYGFRLIFDEADETNEAGGITVFKKTSQIHELYESYFGSC